MLTTAGSPGAWSAQPSFFLESERSGFKSCFPSDSACMSKSLQLSETQFSYLQSGHCIPELPETREIMSRKHLVCAIC